MTDKPRGYELWDLDTGNCIGTYDTVAEALAFVRSGIAGLDDPRATAWVEGVALIEIAPDGSLGKSIFDGIELLKHARTGPTRIEIDAAVELTADEAARKARRKKP